MHFLNHNAQGGQESTFLHPEEALSRQGIEELQARRLGQSLARARHSRFYQGKISEDFPDKVSQNMDLVQELPLTSKDDLREHYPDGFLALDLRQMVRLHASSGTTGTPTAIFYTYKDLESWADLVARCMYMVGMRPGDVFQNLSGYGLFTGGLGIHYGAERLGCLTIPAGAGNSKRQIKLLRDFQVSAMHIIPSYALHLASVFAEMGLDPAYASLRIALIGAEPHSEEIRQRIQDIYQVRAYNSYGLSEMNGPGVAFECPAQDGMHIWEDSYLVEILDPQTNRPVPDGELGELVLTTLNREGMPLIRYRTRDLTRILPGDCPCGREHKRIDRITARADDMIILKGVNIYPMQVEAVLMSVPEVGQNYQIVLERFNYMDQMRVKVEIKDEYFVEDMRILKGLEQKLSRLLREEILVTPKVELVEHKSLPTSQGKAQRVLDLRGQESPAASI